MTTTDPLRETLVRVFGHEDFRAGQREVIEAVARGEDVLAIMPTGGGKSLCFQLPALVRPGLTVVISPLIVLMRDQVRVLEEAGAPAAAITSANSEEENAALRARLAAGELKLLYLAPERLALAGTIAMLRRAGVGLLAVDEAHCVSQWGHDFRPDYLRIGALREALGVPLAAFTATADPETREEIVARLFGGRQPRIFLRGFDRPNLHLAFRPKQRPRRQILDFARANEGSAGIVYCATRARTESLAAALGEAGLNAVAYHGGMEPAARRAVERRFQMDDALVVVATVAFGMGVDKPDVRWVAHADLPKSIEAYWQEVGRAGRDGLPARTLTLFGADDIRLRRAQIDEGLAPPARKAAEHARLNALLGLAETAQCRRRRLLAWFGEEAAPCGNCDNCETPPETFDATEPVRKLLSAALRTGQRYGQGHLIDILLGNATERVRVEGHDALPTFGIGRELDRAGWQAVVRQALAHDLLRPDPERHGGLRLTPAARPVLRGEETVRFRRDRLQQLRARPAPRALVSEEAEGLLAALKALRRRLAEEKGVPAYVIFPDRTLIEMAERRPGNIDEMARVPGVGAVKLERYGAAFLEVIRGTPVAPVHPARRRLAGRPEGALYERLAAAARRLERGESGIERPMFCPPGLLAKIAALDPDPERLERLLGARRMARFGAAFLDILREGE